MKGFVIIVNTKHEPMSNRTFTWDGIDLNQICQRRYVRCVSVRLSGARSGKTVGTMSNIARSDVAVVVHRCRMKDDSEPDEIQASECRL